MPDRVYKMPSSIDERKKLVGEIIDWAIEILGEARQANIDTWNKMDIYQLRHCHSCWTELMKGFRSKTEVQQPAAVAAQEGLFNG